MSHCVRASGEQIDPSPSPAPSVLGEDGRGIPSRGRGGRRASPARHVNAAARGAVDPRDASTLSPNGGADRSGRAVETFRPDPPIDFEPRTLCVSPSGRFAAIGGLRHAVASRDDSESLAPPSSALAVVSLRSRAERDSAEEEAFSADDPDDPRCARVSLLEDEFASHHSVRVLRAQWHPNGDGHLVILLSDNTLRVFDAGTNVAAQSRPPRPLGPRRVIHRRRASASAGSRTLWPRLPLGRARSLLGRGRRVRCVRPRRGGSIPGSRSKRWRAKARAATRAPGRAGGGGPVALRPGRLPARTTTSTVSPRTTANPTGSGRRRQKRREERVSRRRRPRRRRRVRRRRRRDRRRQTVEGIFSKGDRAAPRSGTAAAGTDPVEGDDDAGGGALGRAPARCLAVAPFAAGEGGERCWRWRTSARVRRGGGGGGASGDARRPDPA